MLWRMTQSDANCSLRSNSLIIRENRGNFRDFGRAGSDLQTKYPVFSRVFVRIPYSTDQGILKFDQGILLLDQERHFEQQATRIESIDEDESRCQCA
jgi:hypothetical protein